MATIKQGDKAITDYFTISRVIWDELESYQPGPMCTCDALIKIKMYKMLK